MPNVICDPTVRGEKIIFPPLPIKLGLIIEFVKALRLDGECIQHLQHTFPCISYEKIKIGVFHGSQIRTLVRDQAFLQARNDKEKATCFFCGCEEEFP